MKLHRNRTKLSFFPKTLCSTMAASRWNNHLCAVTRVSMNLRPSNLGTNFSVTEFPGCPFPTKGAEVEQDDECKHSCSEHEVNLTSRSPEEEESATTDAASTEVTRAHEPFISPPATKRSRKTRRNVDFFVDLIVVGIQKRTKPDECSPDLDGPACVGSPRMKARLNLFSPFVYTNIYIYIYKI